MRLVYLGTPDAAVPPLDALVAAGHDVVLVVSRADTRRGRGGAHTPSPVKAAAARLGIPVTDRVDDAVDAGADLGVVVAFGRIIKPHVLDALPMVNLHFSLLPRWRGAAPVERAVLAGDARTGVCVMAVEEGLDTGGVHAREEVEIGAGETAAELRDRLVAIGTRLLVATLDAWPVPAEPQHGEPTYAAKIEPAELRLDWRRPAEELHRVARAGGAWTEWRGARLKVHRAEVAAAPPASEDPVPGQVVAGEGRVAVGTGAGVLDLVEVQPEGRGRQAASAWANGARIGPGDRLGG